mmetsp:Transcript_6558/g.24609  ORF Transcript_6558/g.24609 Transcript_6558/m.24609 type:complete len:564 (-) Transcript_6558:93-1784(-)
MSDAINGAHLQDVLDSLNADIDAGWILSNTFLIFFMQAGFSLLEAGAVRIKNVANILLKNLMCAALCTLGWFGIGYGLAYGSGFWTNPVFGTGSFFLLDDNTSIYAHFVTQWAICSVSVTLCAGAVAERMNLTSYFCYNFVMSSVIYPLIVHAFWSKNGWMSPFNKDNFRIGTVGFMDWAGGTVVHLTGGLVGLMGTILLGPRIGRFRNGVPVKIQGHSKTLMLLGSWILWLGFYGITAGASHRLTHQGSEMSALAAVNTTIAAATGALTTLFVHCVRSGRYDLTEGMNGALAGCVAVTPCCSLIFPWASFFIGCIASVVYFLGCWSLEKLRIDDPLSTVPVHALCGAAGTIVGNGLFSSKKYVSRAYSIPEGHPIEYGLFLGGGWEQLAIQCLGVLVTSAYAIACSFTMFFFLNRTLGLRVRKEVELRGLDLYEGGGMAYALQNAAVDLHPANRGGIARRMKRKREDKKRSTTRSGSSLKSTSSRSHGRSLNHLPTPTTEGDAAHDRLDRPLQSNHQTRSHQHNDHSESSKDDLRTNSTHRTEDEVRIYLGASDRSFQESAQ